VEEWKPLLDERRSLADMTRDVRVLLISTTSSFNFFNFFNFNKSISNDSLLIYSSIHSSTMHRSLRLTRALTSRLSTPARLPFRAGIVPATAARATRWHSQFKNPKTSPMTPAAEAPGSFTPTPLATYVPTLSFPSCPTTKLKPDQSLSESNPNRNANSLRQTGQCPQRRTTASRLRPWTRCTIRSRRSWRNGVQREPMDGIWSIRCVPSPPFSPPLPSSILYRLISHRLWSRSVNAR
jgi:hypothetical protein